MDEQTFKHLEFIQGVITRMNTNSFQIKGWAIALLTALMALLVSMEGKEDTSIVFAAIPGLLVLWGIDAYYLSLERGFRSLFEKVAKSNNEVQPFDMKTGINPTFWKWLKAMCSTCLLFFYLCLLGFAMVFVKVV